MTKSSKQILRWRSRNTAKQKLSLLLLTLVLNISAYAQQTEQTLSVHLRNSTLKEFFNLIDTQTAYSVLYKDVILSDKKDITLRVSDKPLTEVLDAVLSPRGLSYEFSNKTIVIIPAPTQAHPQQTKRMISGTIADEQGEPVIGANISVQGGGGGTVTNIDGQFTLEVIPSDILTVSYIGYLQQTIPVRNQSIFSIILHEDTQRLEEVVIVGYGTQKRGNLAGSVAGVDNKDIIKAPVSDLRMALGGRVPGLRTVNRNGEPGWSEVDMDIRGFGSALIIVDGVPGSFSQIDPNEIENISILKDASAAVYGVKAANGVILVTTKRGKIGKTRIDFNSTFSWQRPTVISKMVNAADFVELTDEDKINRGLDPLYGPEELAKWRAGGPGYESIDWYDEIIRNYAPQQQYNLSITGGNEALKYFASIGYIDQEGMWKTGSNNFSRYNFRSNVDAQITRRLSTSLNLSGRKELRNSPKTSAANIIYAVQRNYPTYSPYANNNPEYLAETNVSHLNPLAIIDKDVVGYYQGETNVFEGSATINYDMSDWIKGLKAKAFYSYRYSGEDATDFVKKYSLYKYDEAEQSYNVSYVGNDPSNLNKKHIKKDYKTFQGSLTYENTFGGKHDVKGLLLIETKEGNDSEFEAYREYLIDSLHELNAGIDKNKNNGGKSSDESNIGYVGRINYGYDNRYLVEFSFRYDGSSRFPSNSRWGFFPSVLTAWRISEEKFLKNKTDFLNDLKIRFSWGRLGDDSGANSFQFLTGYIYPDSDNNYLFGDDVISGMKSKGLANPNITWYTADMYNIGLDFTLWNGLLSGEVDLFYRKRDGLLATRETALPGTFGSALPQKNLNSDNDRGFEVMLRHTKQLHNGLFYSIKGNVSYTRSQHAHQERAPSDNLYRNWRDNKNDRWKDLRWGYKAVGQFQSEEEIATSPVQDGNGNRTLRPGDIKYLDYNGDGVIDENDIHVIGRGEKPEIMFGLDMQFAYKSFDLAIFLQGAARFNAYFDSELQSPFFNAASSLEAFTDRWHRKDLYDPDSEWIPGKYPSTYAGGTDSNRKESSFWLQNATYLRVKDIQFGYTLPKHLVHKVGIEGLRVFVSGHNLFTFTGLDLLDPEAPSGRGQVYPVQKTISCGFNLTL